MAMQTNTIQELWEHFSKIMIAEDCSEGSKMALKSAFYSGISGFVAMQLAAIDQKVGAAAFAEMTKTWAQELQIVAAELREHGV